MASCIAQDIKVRRKTDNSKKIYELRVTHFSRHPDLLCQRTAVLDGKRTQRKKSARRAERKRERQRAEIRRKEQWRWKRKKEL